MCISSEVEGGRRVWRLGFKGQYLIEDNVKANIAFAKGKIADKTVGCTPGVKGDTGICLDDMSLVQMDVTYKF